MNDVELKFAQFTGCWHARCGDASDAGTKEEMIAWLIERRAECIDLTKQIEVQIRLNHYQDTPYKFAAGE